MIVSEDASVAVGDRVVLSLRCPVDFEGVGPRPGDVGKVVSVRGPRACLGVRFDGTHHPWLIPREYLVRVGRRVDA